MPEINTDKTNPFGAFLQKMQGATPGEAVSARYRGNTLAQTNPAGFVKEELQTLKSGGRSTKEIDSLLGDKNAVFVTNMREVHGYIKEKTGYDGIARAEQVDKNQTGHKGTEFYNDSSPEVLDRPFVVRMTRPGKSLEGGMRFQLGEVVKTGSLTANRVGVELAKATGIKEGRQVEIDPDLPSATKTFHLLHEGRHTTQAGGFLVGALQMQKAYGGRSADSDRFLYFLSSPEIGARAPTLFLGEKHLPANKGEAAAFLVKKGFDPSMPGTDATASEQQKIDKTRDGLHPDMREIHSIFQQMPPKLRTILFDRMSEQLPGLSDSRSQSGAARDKEKTLVASVDTPISSLSARATPGGVADGVRGQQLTV